MKVNPKSKKAKERFGPEFMKEAYREVCALYALGKDAEQKPDWMGILHYVAVRFVNSERNPAGQDLSGDVYCLQWAMAKHRGYRQRLFTNIANQDRSVKRCSACGGPTNRSL